MGMWGFWMPGFMQFITGTYLLVGLTWFSVFGNAAPLYMAGLALDGSLDRLVCHGTSPLYRVQLTAGWLDGDGVPVHQPAGG